MIVTRDKVSKFRIIALDVQFGEPFVVILHAFRRIQVDLHSFQLHKTVRSERSESSSACGASTRFEISYGTLNTSGY